MNTSSTTQSEAKELDLAGTIRPGLDILANEIVIALKKRTRFLCNMPIYVPGLVIGQTSISLLEYELHSAEHQHAELGRYQFAAQEAFTDVSQIAPIIKRQPPNSAVRNIPSGVGQKILTFYQSWIKSACQKGTDETTFGETVTSDVNALLTIMERVNLGKSVGESKYREQSAAFHDTEGNRDAMLELIVRKDRMNDVLKLARKLALHYEIDADHVTNVFEFMMHLTIDIEVDYIRKRMSDRV